MPEPLHDEQVQSYCFGEVGELPPVAEPVDLPEFPSDGTSSDVGADTVIFELRMLSLLSP